MSCGRKRSPKPIYDRQIEQQVVTTLWPEKLKEIPDSTGKQYFESGLAQLSISNQRDIWDLLNVIQDPTKQRSFLLIFMSFGQGEQKELFKILLYLRGKNQPLLDKLIDPDQELTIMEKVEMWRIINKLSDPDQRLVGAFKKKLDDNMKS